MNWQNQRYWHSTIHRLYRKYLLMLLRLGLALSFSSNREVKSGDRSHILHLRTEKRYAQIEKEPLVVTWACEKFNDYILGSTFLVESDHKSLIALLSTKSLNDLPSRILRFRLRMNKYNYSIRHVAGKELYTADTFPEPPHSERLRWKNIPNHNIGSYVDAVMEALPTGKDR